MENINSLSKNYISSALPNNLVSNETVPPISFEEKQLNCEIFYFSAHSTPKYTDNIYISAGSDSIHYPDYGPTRIKLLSACSSQSSHTGYDEVLNLSHLIHPDSVSRFKFISRAWEFYPRNQSSLVESFDFKVRNKFFIERSNSIRSFLNINNTFENHSNPEALAEIHRFTFQVSNHLKTSIYIKSGDRISLSASGAIDLGALLYRVGENGTWKACNSSTTTLQTEAEGYLEFKINGQNISNNPDIYQMEVRVHTTGHFYFDR